MRPCPDAAMIFAAGFGTRMGALTQARPKPMITVSGRPLIDYAVALADDAGIARKVVNLHYLGAQIRAHLAHRPDISFSDEAAGILDTGGGLRAARSLLGGDAAFTLNSDAVWTGPNPLPVLRARWQTGAARVVMALAPVTAIKERTGPGDFTMDKTGRIVRRGGDMVYLGAQIMDLHALDGMPTGAFSLNRVWDVLIAQGSAEGVIHLGGWCDVGHPAGIAEAEQMVKAATCA